MEGLTNVLEEKKGRMMGQGYQKGGGSTAILSFKRFEKQYPWTGIGAKAPDNAGKVGAVKGIQTAVTKKRNTKKGKNTTCNNGDHMDSRPSYS